MTVHPAVEWLETVALPAGEPPTSSLGGTACSANGSRRNGLLTHWLEHDGPDLAFAESWAGIKKAKATT